MAKYDYLIIGAGLFGSICAYELTKQGKKCLVVEKRNHIGGNCYTEKMIGINVHMYGPHIFHTNDCYIWQYINQFAEFNNFVNSPLANYKSEIYNLPFNMNTFRQLWGITTPKEAQDKINEQKMVSGFPGPKNLEEQAIELVGLDIYNKLIKGYTEKQWLRKTTELSPNIIKRLPLRFTYDNNYFNAKYQGIPIGGYTQIFGKLLDNIEIVFNCDYVTECSSFKSISEKIIYTGPIDKYFNYCFGELEYIGRKFSDCVFDTDNYQGVAVMNFTDDIETDLRAIEHKHFEFGTQSKTVVTFERSIECRKGDEPFYPVDTEENRLNFYDYRDIARNDKKVIFGGRLGTYQYLDMDETISLALNLVKTLK